MDPRIAVVAVTALLVVVTGPLSAQTQDPETPSLAGKWQIDPTRSDRPSRMDRGGLPGGFGGGRRPGGGGRPGGGTGSFPGGGGRGRGGLGGIPGEGGSPVIMQLLRPSQQFGVKLTDSTVEILDGAGFKRVLWSDGREITDTLFGGQVRRTRVKRKEHEFVLEQSIDGDTKIREKYRLDEKQGDLVFDLKLESKQIPIPVEIRRVYLRIRT